MKKIKMLIKEPYKEPYVKEVEDTLENMQEIVGGLIDCVNFPNIPNVDIFVNDEGKLDRLDGNFWLPEYQDCVVGTCYMVGYDPKTGDSISLTDKQIEKCKKYISLYELPKGMDLYMEFPLLEKMMMSKYKSQQNKAEL